MRLKIITHVMSLALGIGLVSFGAYSVEAAEGGIPGAPSREYTSIDQLPKGIQNKVNENGSYKDPSKSFNENSRWGQAIKDIQDFNAGGGGGGDLTNVAGGTAPVVCPTSLTDEEMRVCLGLPAVKKAVRVKRLNVQLGQAQD